MDCPRCEYELIHGGDHDADDCGYMEEGIVSNLHCPECNVEVLIFYPVDDGRKKDEGS